MRVLVFESNLFWSSRIVKSLSALGHEPLLVAKPADQYPEAQAAILNLGVSEFEPSALVPALRSKGVFVIGHAGHKEIDLRQMGKKAGCDRIASNSEMTFKLESLLLEAASPGN
ncbi:MAG TPA: hypothetical protein PLX06_05605 [Fimbriimonadaceae bacterium]|nr:hypothetical protein [Fimbriimonadaceae bacterium]